MHAVVSWLKTAGPFTVGHTTLWQAPAALPASCLQSEDHVDHIHFNSQKSIQGCWTFLLFRSHWNVKVVKDRLWDCHVLWALHWVWECHNQKSSPLHSASSCISHSDQMAETCSYKGLLSTAFLIAIDLQGATDTTPYTLRISSFASKAPTL